MKDFKKIRKHRRLYRTGRWASRKFGWLIRAVRWLAHKLRFLRIFRFLNPFRYIKKLDWYIIKKFLATILLHRPDHLHRHRLRLQREPVKIHRAPCTGARNHLRLLRQLRALFANLFSALFVFVAVILFHHQAGKQFRNHRHPGVGSILQASPSPIHDYLRAALSPLLRASATSFPTEPSSGRTSRRCTRTRRRIPVPRMYSCR